MRGTTSFLAVLAIGLAVGTTIGCGERRESIKVEGSDTMVNIAQRWAEVYTKEHEKVNVQVKGGGSGVGIAAMINDTCDIANASRTMEDEEIEKVKEKHGKDPMEHVVGWDALAVYVHKDNPLDEISIKQIAEIYGENPTITTWQQLGVDVVGEDKIVRVGRQNSSGTFVYFREAVLGKEREYEAGTMQQGGSKDVVATVGTMTAAIGYSGMGYATDAVKMLKVRTGDSGIAAAPTIENAQNKSYPITRPLLIYTIGEPTGSVKEYLDWIKSEKGQAIVAKLDYVPVMVEK